MGKILFLALFLILFSSIAYAATISGTIYDISLNKVDNVIVTIDTIPKQQYISKDGSYNFNAPVGEYTIKANYYLNNILDSSATEKISVRTDGTFRLDLILFPSFEEENSLLNETEFNMPVLFEERIIWPYVLIVVIILLLIILYYWKKGKKRKKIKERKKLKKETKPGEKKEEKIETPKEILPADLNQVIKIIKKEGGRATQKEVRQQIPLSEAKISLMIAELEHDGKIKKIKKGRGNIIVLK